MCLALFQKRNLPPLPEEYFENGYRCNSHGCGYMFVGEHLLVVRKAFWKWEDAYNSYLIDHEENPDSHFGVHFRLGTQGAIDDSNCHPHIIKSGRWAMMHTGMMSLRDNSKKSDSALMAELLAKLSHKELLKINQNARVQSLIGTYNTLTLMSKNSWMILNESIGHWKDGIWRSNHSYDGYRFRYSHRSEFFDDFID